LLNTLSEVVIVEGSVPAEFVLIGGLLTCLQHLTEFLAISASSA
jgi:hypothetical protein